MDTTSHALSISRIKLNILHISLNQPDKLNILTPDLLKELYDILRQARDDNRIRAILITGEGKAFCAGADINELSGLDIKTGLEFAQRGQRVFQLLENLGKPSLVAVNGFALGGGCELALAATFRIASSSASFGQPEIKLGILPCFGGTQRLSRLVGKGRALDMCLTGRVLKAQEALSWGLVSEVVAPEKLMERAQEMLEGVTRMAPMAIANTIKVIQHGYDLPLETALEMEAFNFALCCATQDKAEGVKAFLEKRVAQFHGE